MSISGNLTTYCSVIYKRAIFHTGTIFVVILLICFSSPDAYGFWWNNKAKNDEHILVHRNSKIENKRVQRLKPNNDYQVIYYQDNKKYTMDCNDLKKIIEVNSSETRGDVLQNILIGSAATAALIAVLPFTGGLSASLIPISISLTGGAIGGGVTYIKRGLTPNEFCHT